MSSHKRKFSNFLLQPLVQIRLGLYSIILCLIFCVVLFGILYTNLHNFYDIVLELTDLRGEVTEILRAQAESSIVWIVLSLLGYFAVTVGVSIYFTHKLVGPTYAFRRHIRDMIKGNFNSRIHLRKGDAFHEVARDLNELAQLLEIKNKQ